MSTRHKTTSARTKLGLLQEKHMTYERNIRLSLPVSPSVPARAGVQAGLSKPNIGAEH